MASYFPKMPNFGIFNGMALREYLIDRYLPQSDETLFKKLVKTAARATIRYTTVAIPYIKYATSLPYWTAASNSVISGAMILNLAMKHKREVQKNHPKLARIRHIKARAIKILPFIAMSAFDIYLLKNMDIKTLDSIALLYTVIWTGADLCGKSKELNSLCSKSFKVVQKAYLLKMQKLTKKLFPPSEAEHDRAARRFEKRHLRHEDVAAAESEDDGSHDYDPGEIGGGSDYEDSGISGDSGEVNELDSDDPDDEDFAFSGGGDSESDSGVEREARRFDDELRGAERPVFGRGFLCPDESFYGDSEDEPEEKGIGSRLLSGASAIARGIGSLIPSSSQILNGEDISMQDLGDAGYSNDEEPDLPTASPPRTNERYGFRDSISPPNKFDPCNPRNHS
ncbi:MAG: hypothetical protein KR126chlam6_00289 [Candidatus Anoxychlamydiales bacterium]|nr:hypothetical protein [Candidatus Anoxychlamydiales bacterium]